MSARPQNSFELKGKMITASGQTLALADIAAVRRKSQYRPRRAGLIMFLCGLILLGWGWRDETTERQERQAKFARDYATAEQQMGADGSTAAMDGIQPLDITQALRTDAQLKSWGAGLLGVGLVYALARRRRHDIIVTTGGRVFSIYRAKTQAQANQIVEEIAAKMG
jgi:hypothetical protein